MAKHLEKSFTALQGLKTAKQDPWHIAFAILNAMRLIIRGTYKAPKEEKKPEDDLLVLKVEE